MMSFTKLKGIYNAEGTISGEIKYFLGKLAGTTSCSLCDISHKLVIEKPEFTALKNVFPELEMLHINEVDTALAILIKGNTPCVVGLKDEQWQIVLNKDELDTCNGNVDKFSELLQNKIQK